MPVVIPDILTFDELPPAEQQVVERIDDALRDETQLTVDQLASLLRQMQALPDPAADAARRQQVTGTGCLAIQLWIGQLAPRASWSVCVNGRLLSGPARALRFPNYQTAVTAAEAALRLVGAEIDG